MNKSFVASSRVVFSHPTKESNLQDYIDGPDEWFYWEMLVFDYIDPNTVTLYFVSYF